MSVNLMLLFAFLHIYIRMYTQIHKQPLKRLVIIQQFIRKFLLCYFACFIPKTREKRWKQNCSQYKSDQPLQFLCYDNW